MMGKKENIAQEARITYSVEEVLNITINNLQGISVPIELIDSVAIPIKNSIGNLLICLQAIIQEREAREAAAAAKQPAEPEETEAAEDGSGSDAE